MRMDIIEQQDRKGVAEGCGRKAWQKGCGKRVLEINLCTYFV